MSPITQSQVEELVTELSTECYQTGITIKIVSDPLIGVGIYPRTKKLKISQWVLDELSESQIRYILGHEIGHLALEAYLTLKSLKWILFVLPTFILVPLSFIAVIIMNKIEYLSIISPLYVVILSCGIYIMIKDEVNADLFAVTLTGEPQKLLPTLEFLLEKRKEILRQIPKTLSIKVRLLYYKILLPVGKLEFKFRKKQLQELMLNQSSSSTP